MVQIALGIQEGVPFGYGEAAGFEAVCLSWIILSSWAFPRWSNAGLGGSNPYGPKVYPSFAYLEKPAVDSPTRALYILAPMKGVVLAGGLGSRLYPLTKVTNKHLLPVYDRPMVYYSIEKLVEAQIQEILLVTGGNNAGDFLRLLGSGREFGLNRISYTYQEGEGGIAAALALAEDFADGERIVVLLADNIFEAPLTPYINSFKAQSHGAKILLKEVSNPAQFGVVEVRDGRVVSIEEKPAHPKSPYAQIGVYFYDGDVFDIIRGLKPSARGELEITDVNNVYLKRGCLTYEILKGFWVDAGESIESYFLASARVREWRQGRG